METPFFRELKRLMEEDMRICDGTLSNWLSKGVPHLKKMIPYLLAMALEKDAIVNCDETWCRVRMEVGGYKKKYIWCLVNKAAHIVIYLYDDGSRGRDVLRDILKDTQIAALQSDGRTTDIMIAMSTRLNELLLDENAHLGDMMQKALRYLNTFWKQLFAFSFNHTFIATCQMMGMSVLKYFKSLFSAIAKGRTDYENMLPMTIGLCKAV